MSLYSPGKRTALVFTGTGTDGVYHAGVLRAFLEAGVKVDVVAGHGVGAVTATFAALGGSARLWESGGLWDPARMASYYRWRAPVRMLGWLGGAAAVLCAVPLVVLLLLAAGQLLAFLLMLISPTAGAVAQGWIASATRGAFAAPVLPTVVPRLLMAVAVAALLVVLVVTVGGWRGSGRPRWWRPISNPFDATRLRRAVRDELWRLVRGATTAKGTPAAGVVGRQYVDVLAESLGQPGCHELVVGVLDLDARRDLVAAVLRPGLREPFVASRPGRERAAEALDLVASGKETLLDLLGAAVTPPVGVAPCPVRLPADGYWAGETHRGCDRPGMLAHLLVELDALDVTQVIIVSAAAPPGEPHRLDQPSAEPRARLGESLSAIDAAAREHAVRTAQEQFDAVFTVRPKHNALGPFDVRGARDRGSDVARTLTDLQQQGYHDAYHQFIEPVVGGSGEFLATALT